MSVNGMHEHRPRRGRSRAFRAPFTPPRCASQSCCRTYFRYFKVDLYKSCPYWPDDGMCSNRDCSVCECSPDEIPACWREEDEKALERALAGERGPGADAAAAKLEAKLSAVDFRDGNGTSSPQAYWPEPAFASASSASSSASSSSSSSSGSKMSKYDSANVWCVPDDDDPASSPDVRYVDLLANPEGYTGYFGPSAARIWQAVYSENCFTGPLEGMCLEERVLFRVISGLQSSINTHIAMTYNDGKGLARRDQDLYQQPTHPAVHAFAHKASVNATVMERVSIGAGALWAYLQDGVAAFSMWAGDRMASSILASSLGLDAIPRSLPEAYHPGLHATSSKATGATIEGAAAGVTAGGRVIAGESVTGLPDVSSLTLTHGLKPSIDMYVTRIGKFPDRVKNLYFAFLFLVRAVSKARNTLLSLDYSTGNATEDARTRALIERLLDVELPALTAGFDESALFKVARDDLMGSCPPVLHGLDDLHDLQHRYIAAAAAKEALRTSFREKFRNISRIMDCVGCEKCRLWGKLQFLGMGTALKVLFADAETTGAGASLAQTVMEGGSTSHHKQQQPPLDVHLTRNEAVAMLNLLHRLSMSISAVHVMRDLEARAKIQSAVGMGATIIAGVLLLVCMCFGWRRALGRGNWTPASASAAASTASKSASATVSKQSAAAAGGDGVHRDGSPTTNGHEASSSSGGDGSVRQRRRAA